MISVQMTFRGHLCEPLMSAVPIKHSGKPLEAVVSELQCAHLQLDDFIHHSHILFKETNKADGDC